MLNEARGPHDSFDVERPKEFEVPLLSLCRVVANRGEAQPLPPSTVAQFTVTKRSEFARRSGRQRRASEPARRQARAPLLSCVNYLTWRKCDDASEKC